jgi:hypothetical protein
MDDRCLIPAETSDVLLSTELRPALWPPIMGTGHFAPEIKRRVKKMELYLHSHIYLHGVVLT